MPSDPAGQRLLITAGPTHEPIDAVRYLGNRSSGRLGIGLAAAAAAAGWTTTLLLGPTPLSPPHGSSVTTRRFQTTTELQDLLAETWPRHDVLIMAAAVADYRPVRQDASAKWRRTGERVVLELESTPDLVAGLASTTRPDQVTIGFALEPAATLLESARDKLRRKHLDAIVANPLETMESSTITARVLLADGRDLVPAPDLDKAAFGAWLVAQIPVIRDARAAA